MRVFFYQTGSGRSPVTDELDGLPLEASAHAYAKKSQKAPKKELETAWQRLFDAQKRGL